MSKEEWDRLGEFVAKRMDELSLKQAEIQQRGGPSPAKVREITSRRATAMSPSKRRDLERAIEWKPGSIDTVLAGGQPQGIDDAGGLDRREQARRIVNAAPTTHDKYFDRAERLLVHSQESVRHGDHLGAIHGLEGVQSTVELLIDRITDLAIEDAEEGDIHVVETETESATSPEGDEDEEVVRTTTSGPEPPLEARRREASDAIRDRFRRSTRARSGDRGERPPGLSQ